MIQEYKHKTNVGVGLGFVLSGGVSSMMRDPETRQLAGVLALISLSLLVWGCSSYARAKGHSPWWGALGIFSIFGFFVLIFLPDRCKDGERRSVRKVNPKDEAFLFPSDARAVTTSSGPRAEPRLGAPSGKREFRVRFGSAVAIDQFGFVREGWVVLDGDRVRYSGPKHWSLPVRAGVFLLVAALAGAVIGVLLGVVLALGLLHYFAASPGELEFSLRSVRDVQRSGRKLAFRAEDPRSGALKKSVLRLESEKVAVALERALGALPLAQAA